MSKLEASALTSAWAAVECLPNLGLVVCISQLPRRFAPPAKHARTRAPQQTVAAAARYGKPHYSSASLGGRHLRRKLTVGRLGGVVDGDFEALKVVVVEAFGTDLLLQGLIAMRRRSLAAGGWLGALEDQ
eukprot:scaffold3619_cov328-Prasinococcus_capsulatus_cf.AAC.5